MELYLCSAFTDWTGTILKLPKILLKTPQFIPAAPNGSAAHMLAITGMNYPRIRRIVRFRGNMLLNSQRVLRAQLGRRSRNSESSGYTTIYTIYIASGSTYSVTENSLPVILGTGPREMFDDMPSAVIKKKNKKHVLLFWQEWSWVGYIHFPHRHQRFLFRHLTHG